MKSALSAKAAGRREYIVDACNDDYKTKTIVDMLKANVDKALIVHCRY